MGHLFPINRLQGVLFGLAIAEAQSLSAFTAIATIDSARPSALIWTTRLWHLSQTLIPAAASQSTARHWLEHYQPSEIESGMDPEMMPLPPLLPSPGDRTGRSVSTSTHLLDLVLISLAWSHQPTLQPALQTFLQQQWGAEAEWGQLLLQIFDLAQPRPLPPIESRATVDRGQTEPRTLGRDRRPCPEDATSDLAQTIQMALSCGDRSAGDPALAIALSEQLAQGMYLPTLSLLTGVYAGFTQGMTALSPVALARLRSVDRPLVDRLLTLAQQLAALYLGLDPQVAAGIATPIAVL